MEYEIPDGEGALFDRSTNPSLDRGQRRWIRNSPPVPPQRDPRGTRDAQFGELIPEEDEQAA